MTVYSFPPGGEAGPALPDPEAPEARAYPQRPIPAVGVVVWWGARVLIVRRRNPPQAGQWSLPGGLQKLGETIFNAARREVFEETGIKAEPLKIITVVDHVDRDIHGVVQFHFIIVEVGATSTGGVPSGSSDVSEARWATVEEAEALIVNETVKKVLRQALAQRII